MIVSGRNGLLMIMLSGNMYSVSLFIIVVCGFVVVLVFCCVIDV